MKNFYKNFLYVPKNGKGKICEKVMLTRIAISIALIIVCMAAMSITAYAYFSANISSNNNVIKTARWEIAVQAESDVTLNDGYYVLDNSANSNERIYEFTVSKDQNANATVGYARIDIKNVTDNYASVQTFYTQPIGEFLQGNTKVTDNDRTVIIVVPSGRIYQVEFIGEWGSCAKEPIVEESNGIELQNLQTTLNTKTKDIISSQTVQSQTQSETVSSSQPTTDATLSSSESTTDDTTQSDTQTAQTESESNTATESDTPTTEETE